MNKFLLIALVVIVAGLAWMSLSISSVNAGSGRETVSLTTDPNPLQAGPVTFIISVKDKTGKPVDSASVFFDLNMTTMNMGTQHGSALSQGSGRYTASGRLSMRGPWRVATKVTMPGGGVLNKNFILNVP